MAHNVTSTQQWRRDTTTGAILPSSLKPMQQDPAISILIDRITSLEAQIENLTLWASFIQEKLESYQNTK